MTQRSVSHALQPRLLLAGLALLLAWVHSQAAKTVLLKCPGQCTKYGVCNPELGRCDCLKNMTGSDCSTPLSKEELVHRCAQLLFVDTEECLSSRHSCLNACNNRGTCEAGFCLCNEGHYGADCSLSISPDGVPTLLYNSSWTLRKKRPWIYVYELPPRLTTWTNPRRLDRPTHHMFWQRLLSSGARTADPYQADWLYIPVRQRGMSDRQWLADAITYIDNTWPFWKEFGQHRHFMFNTADMGVDEADHDGLAMASNITWLTHWGLHTMHPFTKWRAAHRPGKDVVVPVFVSSGHYKHFGMERTPHHPAYDHSNNTRDKMFFFAGRICGHRGPPDDKEPWPRNCGKEEDRYSAGVRQAVHYFHHNRTGWQVALFERKYARALATTKFCLAPLGGGHGQRQVLAAFMGCIPVTIGDNVYQPFEPELPWSEFAVQVPENQVPQLHTILEAISDKKRAAMLRGLRCAAQHFLWSSIMGGIMLETGKYDAFETILEILRMKHQYPNADPKEYVKLDADFRRFAACGAEEQTQDPPAEPTKVCSHSVLEGLRPPSCYKCLIGSSPTHGYPGGVVCCGTKRYLGSCPRTWD